MKISKMSFLVLIASIIPLLGFQHLENPDNAIVDIFKGEINTSEISETVLFGEISYDKNCIGIGNGLTRCDAGFKTNNYGVINFNYTHKMMEKSCLVPGQKVMMKIQDDQNKGVYIIR